MSTGGGPPHHAPIQGSKNLTISVNDETITLVFPNGVSKVFDKETGEQLA